MQAGDKVWVKTKDGKNLEVPPFGSLGLLAMGYKGIMLWRQARQLAGDSPVERAKAMAAALAIAEKEKAAKKASDQKQ